MPAPHNFGKLFNDSPQPQSPVGGCCRECNDLQGDQSCEDISCKCHSKPLPPQGEKCLACSYEDGVGIVPRDVKHTCHKETSVKEECDCPTTKGLKWHIYECTFYKEAPVEGWEEGK